MKKLTVIKIGGNVVDEPQKLAEFLLKLHKIDGPKILIHGGGKIASQISPKLGIEVKIVNGRRVTDEKTLRLVTAIYAGLINKQIVAKLQGYGSNAIGLSGADGGVVPAVKRDDPNMDWGYVGDIDSNKIDTLFLEQLLGRGMVPVFCSITHDSNGTLLNTNADTMASAIAVAMTKDFNVDLIYCFEKDGVLYDKDDDTSIIPLITPKEYNNLLKDKVIADGMIPKMDNAFKALNNGVCRVIIKNADNLLNDKESIIKL